jgi:hypothetical protein
MDFFVYSTVVLSIWAALGLPLPLGLQRRKNL